MKDSAAQTISAPRIGDPDPDHGRGNTLGRALWLCDWLSHRRFPFTATQLAADMEASKRTALRWLAVAEGIGLVDCDRSRPTWRWTTRRR